MEYDLGKIGIGGEFQPTKTLSTPDKFVLSAVMNLRSVHGRHGVSTRMTELLEKSPPHRARPTSQDRLFMATYEHTGPTTNCDGCDSNQLVARPARPHKHPMIFHGVVASGDRVVKHAQSRDDIASKIDALCFEMEAAGIMYNLSCLPIRGICDYSDSHKNKEWQPYAAFAAATYARELIEILPPISAPQASLPTEVHATVENSEYAVLGGMMAEEKNSKQD
jgi:hypothetical protein